MGIVIPFVVLIVGITLLVVMVVRDQKDTDFNPDLPYNICEAIVAYHAGMNVTCGRKTNRMMSGYWVCSRHPVPFDAPTKEKPRNPIVRLVSR